MIRSAISILVLLLGVTQITANDVECIKAVGLTNKEKFQQDYCPFNETDELLIAQYKEVAYCVLTEMGIMSHTTGTVDPVQASEVLTPAEDREVMLSVATACTLEDEEFDSLVVKAEEILQCYRTENSTLFVHNCQNYVDKIIDDLF